jgi:hypothetical protein
VAREIYRHLLRLGLLSEWFDLVSQSLNSCHTADTRSIATTYVSISNHHH